MISRQLLLAQIIIRASPRLESCVGLGSDGRIDGSHHFHHGVKYLSVNVDEGFNSLPATVYGEDSCHFTSEIKFDRPTFRLPGLFSSSSLRRLRVTENDLKRRNRQQEKESDLQVLLRSQSQYGLPNTSQRSYSTSELLLLSK